ncbi:MAG: ATP-binding protein [Hyphomicrobiales bacterium]|nr:ATP-binding protein [Hyphomicrobiales bacterium]
MNAPMAKPTDMIRVSGLTMRYGPPTNEFVALSEVALDVRAGEFATIVGPSGCGKSTLLQAIAGLVKPTSGAIEIDGRQISGPSPDIVGVMFQDAWLLPWKTAQENVEFPLALRRAPAADRAARAMDLLRLVGLETSAGKYPDQLSGGMRQRVAIARSLAQRPKVLLMDEPFAALDEQTRTRMGNELLQIWEESGGTVLFVTHGLTEAIFLADVVHVMGARPGRIIERIEVDLPRPRTIDMIGSEYFGQLRNRIWNLISDTP